MVDTICLRIQNLFSYSWIGEVLDLSIQKQGISVLQVQDVPGDYQNHVANIREIRYNDSGKRKVCYSNKIFLKSSHYYLAYKIDDQKNCIDFNFSIPKYLYGSNVMQFVPLVTDRKNYHARSDLEKFEYNMEISFKRLMVFLDYFLNKLKYTRPENGVNVTYEISKNDVEITRLDLCFNQYFYSQNDALTYLKYQKRIKKSYLRENSKNKTDWGSSIFLQSKNYVAKIYHKGMEYSSKTGEKKHHEQVNKHAKKEVFPILKIQNEADRILRYEISFKNSFISRIFKKKVFRKNDAFHKDLKLAYKIKKKIDKKCDSLDNEQGQLLLITHDINSRNEIIAKYNEQRRIVRLPLYKKLDFIKKFQLYVKGSKDNTITVKQAGLIYNQMLNQSNVFMLNVDKKSQAYNEKTSELVYDRMGCIKLNKEAKFDEKIFKEMTKVFREFIDEFQLDEKLQMDQVGLHVREYNKYVDVIKDVTGEKKIYEGPLARVAALMENYTIDEMVTLGIISRRTKYNILNTLKKVHFSKGSILPHSIKTSVDFVAYHFERNNMESFNGLRQ